MTCTMATANRMTTASSTSFCTFATVWAWIGSPPSRKTSAQGGRETTRLQCTGHNSSLRKKIGVGSVVRRKQVPQP
jgi:hypothetical protein